MGFKECLELAKSEPFVEFRFDLLDLSPVQVEELVRSARRSIATCRPGSGKPAERFRTLATALKAGADYIDIELDSESGYREDLRNLAGKQGSDVIISYHNFEGTPGTDKLEEIAGSCLEAGADVVKIACKVNRNEDVQNLLGLYGKAPRMVVVGMGDKARITRVAAPFLGAEFTFASPGTGRETAPGQMDRKLLQDIIARIKGTVPIANQKTKESNE